MPPSGYKLEITQDDVIELCLKTEDYIDLVFIYYMNYAS